MDRFRQRISQRRHFRSGEPDVFDAGRKQWPGKLGVNAGGEFAHLQHVAEDRDAPPLTCRLGRCEHGDRRAHGGRVGIVAVVDKCQDAFRHHELVTRTASLDRRKIGQRLDRRIDVGADKRHGREDRHRVLGEMAAGRTDHHFARFAAE